ncbi:glycosyltransferase family 1 protein [Robertkochia marina]|uniref:Glycosyltransferase family 1 protein n=1 Tax=Robertkochia marina TaxID=1227945 RepID=A0A4S3LYR8_9FLAO|nr:glycosyltransferase family 4 protein [Robertkochia marina]THD66768.1 glycosyltransferase family 1 protein [Robertkochia marina]TRZ42344.1 glycosyltransferase family 1 protein [Robertkochia marina]
MSVFKLIRVTTIPISLGSLLKGQLGYMQNHFEVLGISSKEDQYVSLEEYGRSENIRVIPVEMTRSITPYKDLKALYHLFKIFKQEQPDIVHSHTPKAGTLAMLAAKLAGVPHRLHTIAGLPLLESRGAKRKLLNLVERITYRCATKIYPNSNGLKEIVLREGFTHEKKLKVIGNGSSNGIDVEYFDPSLFNEVSRKALKDKLGIPQNNFVFIFSGRYVKDKGVNELVNAFVSIHKNYRETSLLLIGCFEEDLDPLLPETVAAIKNHPAIYDTGWHREFRPYFTIADALLFPSYREGFPNTVMQAGAMGIYSIVSNINGCNEIIIDGQNGRIIPPKDTVALKNAMLEALSTLRPSEGYNSYYRQLIIQRYSRPYIWEALLNEYQTLLGKKTQHPSKEKEKAYV